MIFRQVADQFQSEIVRCSFVSVLVVMITRLALNKWIHTKTAIVIIKWLLIASAFFNLTLRLTEMVEGYFGSETVTYVLTAYGTGKYGGVFWFMLISGTLLPFMLFMKSIGNNVYMLLLISLLLNIGWLLELITIHLTNIELGFDRDKSLDFPTSKELILIFQGFIIGVIVTLIGNFIDERRKSSSDQSSISIM